MKVLIVSLWPISKSSIGGTERFVLDLAKSLKLKGQEVGVIMLSGTSCLIDGIEFQAINIDSGIDKIDEYSIKEQFFSEFNKDSLVRFAQFLEKACPVDDYDLIHLNSLVLYEAFKNKKRVFTLHENPFEFEHTWGEGSFTVLNNIINLDKPDSSTLLTAPSYHYSKLFSEILGVDIHTIPHAIDRSRLFSHLSKDDVRRKYHLKDKFTFIVPCRLEIIQKRQDLALKSIGQVRDEITRAIGDFQVVFTGLDKQYEANIDFLKSISSNFGINSHFINFSDISEAYTIADIVLLPSRSESFGYSALEVLSYPLPTVLSNIPTFKEIASDNSYSEFAPSNTQDAFAASILNALANNRNRDQELNNIWVDRYDINSWAEKYILKYNKILAN